MVRLYLAIWNKNLLLLLVQENFLGCLYQHFQVLPLVFIDHCWLHFSRLLFHVTSISPWLFRSMKDCTSTELYPTAFCCFLCQVFCFWLFCRWRHFLLCVFNLTSLPHILVHGPLQAAFVKVSMGARVSSWGLKQTPDPSICWNHSVPKT